MTSGVVMLTANYYPYVGGAEGQARSVARALARRQVPVWVVTRLLPGLKKEESVDGIPVFRLAAWGCGSFGALTFAIFTLLHLLRRRACYEVIHVHLASSHAVVAALAGRLLGKRVVVKLGGGKGVGEIFLSKKSALGRLKLRALAVLCPALVAVNPEILEEIPSSGLEGLKTFIIPNGVDLDIFSPAPPEEKARLRRELNWPAGFALLSTSRLTQDKRTAGLLSDFLQAWAAAEKPAGARFYIAGSGPEENSLRTRARALGAESSVIFLGTRHDLETLYRAADAFLLPTISEGVSNSLLEALACGCPALATNVTGTRDIVKEGENGLLYDPAQSQDSRRPLERLLKEPGLVQALGRGARDTAKKYSLENTVNLWLDIYASI